jgi:hypothetical protein
VEFLANGQQWVAIGDHPEGYKFQAHLPEEVHLGGEIPTIRKEDVEAALKDLEEIIDTMGGEVTYKGQGQHKDRADVDQDGIKARSLEQVRTTLSMIPNDERYDERGAWRDLITAIKGSLHEEDWIDGLALAVEWSNARDDFGDQTARVEELWWSIHPPFALGIDVLLSATPEMAGVRAGMEFGVVEGAAPPPEGANRRQVLSYKYSDQSNAKAFSESEWGQRGFLHSGGILVRLERHPVGPGHKPGVEEDQDPGDGVPE